MTDSLEHLIPQTWFDGLPQAVLLIIVAVTIGVMIKGTDWLVDGASGLAMRLGMPKVIVGATIVAMGSVVPKIIRLIWPIGCSDGPSCYAQRNS